MLFAIHAYENIYGGLHGMEERRVIECINEKEAEEYAIDLSRDVIQDYTLKEIEDDAISYGYERESEEFDAYVEECIEDNIQYEIFPIRETTKSIEELDSIYNNYPDDFIKTMCEIRD